MLMNIQLGGEWSEAQHLKYPKYLCEGQVGPMSLSLSKMEEHLTWG